ncbi:hypothetical protein SAMN02745704_01926 [Paucidesulfovibrio gracilis DSM 16080]|uniref:Uncharacterized protein n=1 Tax=Paucidesulfovibrio gracilis DSM 16080 TaxID=1121449 RepID=A0A1T4X8G5_9BACT|nr:hypothetical protein [Paucidesulfovibrio gracilis]SKA85874.1 hypothetical protein SAMN02745704_01926 [Paucidesulfovibrio gracilis DSM 16080]
MRRANIVDGVVQNIAEVAGDAVPEWMQDWPAYEEDMAVGKPWPRDEVADAAEADLARRRQILAELAALDRFLPRSVEDLLDAGVIQLADLSLENQDRRAQKLALRDELAEL